MTRSAVDMMPELIAVQRPAGRCRARSVLPEPPHYQIGPVPVRLSSVLPRVEHDFHELYRSYQVQAAGSDEFHIQVVARRSPRSLRRYLHVLGNGEELFVVRGENEVLPHVEWAVNTLVATRLSQYLQVHASVVARDGVAVVFPGQPGQGKSTLAAGLLARGWSYLSDEFALIDPETQLLDAYPKALCIKAGSFEVLCGLGLPIDACRVYYKGEKGRVSLLDPLKIRPGIVAGPCRLGMVVFPEYRTSSEPVIERMSRAQAVFELTRMAFNFSKFRTQGFNLLADLVGRSRCCRLSSGDLAAACDLVESRFDVADGWED
jgi:HprK-related kinase A